MKLNTKERLAKWLFVLMLPLACLLFGTYIGKGVTRWRWKTVPVVETKGSYEVEAVFIQQAGSYLVLVSEGNVLYERPVGWDGETILVTDAPAGQKSYVSWVRLSDTQPWYKASDAKTTTTIHVHSVDDLQGGEWNYGKGGHGPTVRVR